YGLRERQDPREDGHQIYGQTLRDANARSHLLPRLRIYPGELPRITLLVVGLEGVRDERVKLGEEHTLILAAPVAHERLVPIALRCEGAQEPRRLDLSPSDLFVSHASPRAS